MDAVGEALTNSRRLVIEQGGWTDPTAQGGHGLDVYLIVGSSAGSTRVVPEEDPALSPEEGSGSFVVLAGPARGWASQVLHQYLHVVQLGYSVREPVWFYEASALLFEEVHGGGGAVSPELVSRRLAEPNRSLTAEEPELIGGGAIFLAQLMEAHGDAVLRRAWELAAREYGDNALPALDRALRVVDATSLSEGFREYTLLNAYPDPASRPAGSYASLASPVPSARPARVITSLPDLETSARPFLVEPLGAAYVQMREIGDSGAVRIELEAEPEAVFSADVLVSWRHTPGGWLVAPLRVESGHSEIGVPLEPGSELALVIRNDGAAPGPARRFSLTATAEPRFPFDLAYLAAEPAEGRIELSWGSESEAHMYGWRVYRAVEPQGPFKALTPFPLPSMGDSDRPLAYQFTDAEVTPGTLYYYVVEAITLDGLARRSAPVAARAAGIP